MPMNRRMCFSMLLLEEGVPVAVVAVGVDVGFACGSDVTADVDGVVRGDRGVGVAVGAMS